MKKYLTLLFAVLLFSTIAQTTKEKAIYDSLTNHYAQEAIWDSVIDIGKESIYKGYDFYELRMRIAKAYQEEGNYRLAEKHFNTALTFQPNDTAAAYQLLETAKMGCRISVADHDYASFDNIQKEAISKRLGFSSVQEKMPYKYFDHISASFAYSFTNRNTGLDDLFVEANTVAYSAGRVRQSQRLAQLNAGGRLQNYIRWQLAYNYKQIDGVELFDARNRKAEQGDFQVSQNEIFAGLTFFSGDGWNFNINGMILPYKNQSVEFQLDSIGYIIPSEEADSILIDDLFIGSNTTNQNGSDYAFSASINRKINIIDFSIFANYLIIEDDNPFQMGGEITILPNGSYHLYLSNQIFWHHDQFEDRVIYKVMVGGLLFKKLDFKAGAIFGNVQNTKSFNGPTVYNWSEKTQYTGDFALKYNMNETFSIFILYQISQKTGQYHFEHFSGLISSSGYPGYYQAYYTTKQDQFRLLEHQIKLGLLWKF